MKKLDPPFSNHESIKGLRLTRDDVEFILELFRRDVGSPKLSDEHFEYDSLDEFIERKGTRPSLLEIEARSEEDRFRSFSAKFEGNSVFLHGDSNTPFHEAKDYFCSKRPWGYSVLSPWIWGFTAMMFLNVLNALVQLAEKKQQPIPEWSVYLFGISLMLFLIGLLYRKFGLGLRLARGHEGGFWKRNAEKIVLMLLGSGITALITLFFKLIG
jgi:hypothetical protein